MAAEIDSAGSGLGLMAVPGVLQLADRDAAAGPGGGGPPGSGGAGSPAAPSSGGSAGSDGAGSTAAPSGAGSPGTPTGSGGRAGVPAVLRRGSADGPAVPAPAIRTSLHLLRRSPAATIDSAVLASPVTAADTGPAANASVGGGLATPRIDPEAAAQMRQDVETIVGFLRDGMNNTQQRLVVSIAGKWADRDTSGVAATESSAQQRFPHLARFMVLLQMRSYSRGSWWRDAYGIVYDDLFSQLTDDRLTEFRALAEKCDAASTSGPLLAEQDNVFSYIGKREAVGLWGMLKGMGTTIVGGTVDTLLWAAWKQSGEPLGRVLDRLGIRAEALKTTPKITPFLEKSFDDTAAILGRELNVDIHEQVDLGIARIGTYELGTTGGKVVGGLTMAGAGGGSAGKGVESGLKVVGALSTAQSLEQLGETVVKLRQGDPKAGIPPLTWAQIATRADLWAQVAAAAGGAAGTAGVKKLAVTLGIQGAQTALLVTAFQQVEDDSRYPTPEARSAQKAELFAQIVVNGLTSVDQLHQAAKARKHPFGERNSVIGAEPEPAGVTADPAARDQLFDKPGGMLGSADETAGVTADPAARDQLFDKPGGMLADSGAAAESEPVRIREYGPSRKDKNRPVERHEVLQHAFLKAIGKVQGKRSTGYSRFNTVIELSPEQHAIINDLQRQAGLTDPARLRRMSAMDVIERNLEVLQRAGVPDSTVEAVWDDVSELLPGLGKRAFEGG